jgi:DNA-binding transcriptional MerR regulator
VDDALMPIGMFSRASSLSIKTLRAYHDAGILVPAQVDSSSGYRNYTVDQLADAAIISRLRSLDVPLAHVREVLHARDPDVTRRVLAEHQAVMQARLDDTARIVAELQSGIAPVTHTPVHVREERARDAVCVRGEITADEFVPWLTVSFRRLTDVLARAGVQAAGPPGLLCDAEILDDDVERVEACVPVAAAFDVPAVEPDLTLGEVPAARVAVLVHAGDYTSMPDTYRTLGAWVARNAAHSGERIREWYTLGVLDGDDASAYRTEIAWPILAG